MDSLFGDTASAFYLLPAQQRALIAHAVPYAILAINCVLFALVRALTSRIFAWSSTNNNNNGHEDKRGVAKLLVNELISTCELCAGCAELNVVYELHGSLCYGAALALLSYVWSDAFGDAHTSPGYLAEELLIGGREKLFASLAPAARILGQSLAVPLAWRLAAMYWARALLSEHARQLVALSSAALDTSSSVHIDSNVCRTSLATSTLNGFVLECVCCLVCRLCELLGHKLVECGVAGERLVRALNALLSSALVVLALDTSGGYFNPMLAASLEYNCAGIQLHQHALVFWLGPLLGHVCARALYLRLVDDAELRAASNNRKPTNSTNNNNSRRQQQQRADNKPAANKLQRQRSTRRRHRDHTD